ncbi:MAG: AsmA family protein [Acidobacteriota bacterium]
MKKAYKILAIIAAVLVVAVVGLTIFVKSYLTDERIRTLVTESAEKSLHRKVSLGAISVSIFSGISVKDFAIRGKDSDQDFLKADAFVLKYQLLPLLSKRLIIDELAVESPQIVITKKADGSFNFSDMIRPKEEAAGEKKGEVSGLPVSLGVKSLRIDKARLEYDDPVGTVKRAVVDLDAEMALRAGSDKVIGSSGKVKMTLVEVLLKDRPKPVKGVPISVQYKSEVNLADRKIDISEASIAGLGADSSLKGQVHYGDPLSYTVSVKAPQVNLAAVQKSAAGFLPEGVGLGGGLSVDLTAEQKPVKEAKPTFKGEIVLRNAAVQTKSMRPVFNGAVNFSPDRIDFRTLKLVAGDSTADITGQVLNYATSPDMRIDVASAVLNLDSLMPTAAAADAAAGAAPAAKKDEKEFGPLKSKVRAEGNADIRQMVFKGITVRIMKAHYLVRNTVFTLSSLTGGTLSGTFSGQATADLSKPGAVYSMKAETKGIKLEEITAAFAPKAKENLYGSLSARAEISGAGSLAASIKRNLKGQGSFSVKDGKIRNAQISEGLLAILGLQSLNEIPMEKAGGSFTISGGAINLKSVIASKDLVVSETGTVGLDQRLDMSLLVKVSDALSPKIVSQSGVSQFLSGEKGWTTVPLRLGGTIAKPSYGIDTKAMGKQATEKLQKKMSEELLKALSGEKEKKAGEQPTGTKKEEKGSSPEDLLKGLFK